MKVINTNFKGLKIIKQKKYIDQRGFLRVTHNQKKVFFKKFIYEYCTTSKKSALRGFHFQKKYQQAKYVSVLKGKILDCVVDLRKNSKTFGESFKIILSEKNCLGLYIPEGFAHGYFSYDKENIIYYKLSNYYQPKFEDGIYIKDKTLDIKWPLRKHLISNKDKKLNSFQFFKRKHRGL